MSTPNTRPSAQTVALFPGQGSQHVGMGKDLYQNFQVAREVFEEASDAISVDLKKLCFDGPESDLKLTENTQPCLLTASVAAFRVATMEIDYRPGLACGHSLGEYSALVAIGALPLATAARWVRERGTAMQKAVPAGQGTMAAILGLEDHQVETLCQHATDAARAKRSQGENADLTVEAIVQPANYNSPGQLVIAGSTDAVNEAIALVKAGTTFPGGKGMLLPVSAPFHCKLMEPARARMAELFSAATRNQKPSTLACPYVPNRTGRISSEPGVVLELLIDQIDHPVLWKQGMQALMNQGFTHGIEFGPGKVLQGLGKRVSQSVGKAFTTWGVSDSEGLKALDKQLRDLDLGPQKGDQAS